MLYDTRNSNPVRITPSMNFGVRVSFPVMVFLRKFPVTGLLGNMVVLLCRIGNQWEFVVCSDRSNPVLCDNLEEWDGLGGGRELQEGRDVSTPMTDSC